MMLDTRPANVELQAAATNPTSADLRETPYSALLDIRPSVVGHRGLVDRDSPRCQSCDFEIYGWISARPGCSQLPARKPGTHFGRGYRLAVGSICGQAAGS